MERAHGLDRDVIDQDGTFALARMTRHHRFNLGWRRPILLAGLAALLASPDRATSAPDVAVVAERLYAYLEAYEPRLSELVADEVFEQRTTYVTEYGIRHVAERRRLVSDFGFLRLPGGLAWAGQRSVRSVDDRPVAAVGRLDAMFAAAGADVLSLAKAIVDANARFNVGHARSVNVPTLPLDLLGRRRARAFTATTEGTARVSGRAATVLVLRERAPGSLVAYDGEQFARSDVRAWVGDDGAVLRADVTLRAPTGPGHHDVRVDFALNRTLETLVPIRLTETFEGEFSGNGTATYRNYRRFRTSGRLVPPQPPR